MMIGYWTYDCDPDHGTVKVPPRLLDALLPTLRLSDCIWLVPCTDPEDPATQYAVA